MSLTSELTRSNFLYRTWEGFSHVMRFVVQTDHEVDGQALAASVQEAAKRYPYFCIRIVRNGEDYEILPNTEPVPVTAGAKPICLGAGEANGHYIAAAFREDTIYFDISHNLCDAKGFVPWIKTVLYLYLTKTVDPDLDPEGVNLPGDPFLPNETEDPFDGLVIPDDLEPLYTMKYQQAFVPDTRYAQNPGRIDYYVKADAAQFTDVFRMLDGSPIVLSSYFLKEALKLLFPDRDGLPVCVSIPHSLREGLLGENNYHDQLSYVMIRYDQKMEHLPMDRQLTAGRGSIFLQCAWENMLCQIRSNLAFANELSSLPTVEERRSASRNAVSQFILNPETMVMTYPGRISWGAAAAHIVSVYGHCSVLAAPLMIFIVPLNNAFYFNFQQRDNTDIYARTFVSLLRGHGIDAEVTGSAEAELCSVYIP